MTINWELCRNIAESNGARSLGARAFLDIHNVGLTRRTLTALKTSTHVSRLWHVLAMTRDELRSARGIGGVALADIDACLALHRQRPQSWDIVELNGWWMPSRLRGVLQRGKSAVSIDELGLPARTLNALLNRSWCDVSEVVSNDPWDLYIRLGYWGDGVLGISDALIRWGVEAVSASAEKVRRSGEPPDMPTRYETALSMRLLGYSYTQIGKALAVSGTRARQIAYRAEQLFRAQYGHPKGRRRAA